MFKRSIWAISALIVLGSATSLTAATFTRTFSTSDFAPNSTTATVSVQPGPTHFFSQAGDVGTGSLSLGFQADGIDTSTTGKLQAVLFRYNYDIPIQLLTSVSGSDADISVDYRLKIATFLDRKDAAGTTKTMQLGSDLVIDKSLSCTSGAQDGCVESFSNRFSGMSHGAFMDADAMDFEQDHNLRTEFSVEVLGFESSSDEFLIAGSIFGPSSRQFSGNVDAAFTYITAPPVPVPASLVASGTGLAAFALLGWHRRRRAEA